MTTSRERSECASSDEIVLMVSASQTDTIQRGKVASTDAAAFARHLTDKRYLATEAARPAAAEERDGQALKRLWEQTDLPASDFADEVASFYRLSRVHLPQLLSTTLASVLAGKEQVAGPAAADLTRLALSPYDIWRDIFATNGEPIDAALGAFIARLEEVRLQLRDSQVESLFSSAADSARALRGK